MSLQINDSKATVPSSFGLHDTSPAAKQVPLMFIYVTSVDEDIAMLDTSTPSSFLSCNSSPTHLSCHSRIQQTRRQCFDHNFFIRHRNR